MTALSLPRNPAEALSIRNILILGIVTIVVSQLLLQPKFGTYQNMTNVLRMSSILALVSVGQMMVMVARGFDLSIGATMAMASIVVASVLASLGGDASLLLAIPVAIASAALTGVIIGCVNGVIVTVLKVHSFIVTLGVSSVVTGIGLWLTNGVPIYGLPKPFISLVGRSSWLGLPSFVWVAAILTAVVGAVYRYTHIGKYIMAAGRDERAAALSGISTGRYITMSYILCGICASIAALLLTAQLGSGQATIGAAYSFQSIAVCVIAGVSLLGGSGSMINVILAALFLQLLNNMFELMRMPSQLQVIVAGAIVIAVAVSSRARSGQ